MAKQLLDLHTAAEADQIKIDGELYDLADPGNYTIAQAARLQELGKLLERIGGGEQISLEQAEEADAALDEGFAMIAPSVPKEIAAKLSAGKKSQVLQAFFLEVVASGRAPTGASPSSPASSDSTEAPRANG